MKQLTKYTLTFLGGLTLGGSTGAVGGFAGTYTIIQPQVLIKDINGNGDKDLCVKLYDTRQICSIDFDKDGSQDIVIFRDDKLEKISFGKNVCPIDDKEKETIFPSLNDILDVTKNTKYISRESPYQK